MFDVWILCKVYGDNTFSFQGEAWQNSPKHWKQMLCLLNSYVLGDEKQPSVSVTNVWDMLTRHYNNAVLASYHQKR